MSSRRAPRLVLVLALLLGACAADGAAPPAALERAAAPATFEPAPPRSSTTTTVPATTSTVAGPDLSAAAIEAEEEEEEEALDPVAAVARAAVAQDPVPRGAPRPAAPRPATGRRGPEPTGHIEIPAIGLSHDTYEGIDLATIDHGPSHWPGTAMPGQRGNTVFPGHRTTKTRPFWDIAELRVGDEVVFSNPSGRFTYRVTKTFVVDDEDTSIVDQTKSPTFTIFACHPKGSARQRYVVQGDLVSSAATPHAPPPTSSTTTTTTAPPGPSVGGLLD